MAINYAEDRGITPIGVARGGRMNIYTWPDRIRQDQDVNISAECGYRSGEQNGRMQRNSSLSQQ